jgi:16S rRNA (guanine966-N2)-methyltransferase
MNILADRVEGAVVWDLFSGSGAFGIDCVSSGAEMAVFVDRSPVNLGRIKRFFREKNSLEKCVTVKGKLPCVMSRLIPPADIVFLDPPYADTDIYSWIRGYDWSLKVNPGCVVVVESGGEDFGGSWKHRKYGDTHIHTMEVEQ